MYYIEEWLYYNTIESKTIAAAVANLDLKSNFTSMQYLYKTQFIWSDSIVTIWFFKISFLSFFFFKKEKNGFKIREGQSIDIMNMHLKLVSLLMNNCFNLNILQINSFFPLHGKFKLQRFHQHSTINDVCRYVKQIKI